MDSKTGKTRKQPLALKLVESGGEPFLEGPAGQPLLDEADDVVRLVEACFSEGALGVLLYAENLPPGFVDLSSGVAGTVLQKLQTYRFRAAIVIDLAHTPHSAHFASMVGEANRGREFHFYAERQTAAAWLQGDRDA